MTKTPNRKKKSLTWNCMYRFPVAAVTIHHKLNGLKQNKFIIFQSSLVVPRTLKLQILLLCSLGGKKTRYLVWWLIGGLYNRLCLSRINESVQVYLWEDFNSHKLFCVCGMVILGAIQSCKAQLWPFSAPSRIFLSPHGHISEFKNHKIYTGSQKYILKVLPCLTHTPSFLIHPS